MKGWRWSVAFGRTHRTEITCATVPWRTRTIFTHVHLQRRALTHEAHTHRVPALPLATETVYGIGENDMNVERRTRPMPERTQPTIYFRVQRLLERCVIFPGGILFNANFAIFPEPDFFFSLSLSWVFVRRFGRNYRSPCNSRHADIEWRTDERILCASHNYFAFLGNKNQV